MATPKKEQLRDHGQVKIPAWRGLFSSGMDDTASPGFFLDSLNVEFDTTEVRTRAGSLNIFQKANIRRFFIYKRLNETPRYLILDTNGSLWDSLYSSPLITNSAFKDFSAVNYLNRAYITFHDRVSGISGYNVQVYEGAGPGTLRPAAGSAPDGFTLDLQMSTQSGDLGVGKYIVAVAYETASGFVTAPGPSILGTIDSPGGFKLDIRQIPIGPIGTVARRILITKSIPEGLYTGNQYGYEFFFPPGGRIPNNTDTQLLGLNFFDDDLVDSADYLFDSRDVLPCGLGLTIYNNRMCLWGVPGFEHYVFFSAKIFVETFDQTSGALYLDPSDANSSIKNCVDHETSLFIQSSDRTYVTVDNDNNPTTWRADPLDKALGAEIFSVSKISDSRGTSIRRFFQADPSGLYCFEGGSFVDPAISVNIVDLWRRINKRQFNKVVCVDDPEDKVVYVAVPLDTATECSHILVANYYNAFDKFGRVSGALVRWSLWAYPWQISHLAIDVNQLNQTVFKYSGLEANIYQKNRGVYLDDATRITSYVQFYLQGAGKNVNHYGFIEGRIEGEGFLKIFIYGLNNRKSLTPPRWTLEQTPWKYYQKPINFVDTKMSVKLMCNTNAGEYFKLFDFSFDMKPMWAETPRV